MNTATSKLSVSSENYYCYMPQNPGDIQKWANIYVCTCGVMEYCASKNVTQVLENRTKACEFNALLPATAIVLPLQNIPVEVLVRIKAGWFVSMFLSGTLVRTKAGWFVSVSLSGILVRTKAGWSVSVSLSGIEAHDYGTGSGRLSFLYF